MKWLVAAVCFELNGLSDPMKFMRLAQSRANPFWRIGVVDACDEAEAFDRGFDAFKAGKLEGSKQTDVLVDWWVTPLNVRSAVDESTVSTPPRVTDDTLGSLERVDS